MLRDGTIRFTTLRGLVLSTAKIRMEAGEAQRSENFDYEKPPGTRIRAGYARLLALDGTTVVKATTEPSYIFAFERSDDTTKLVISHGGSMEEFTPGTTEWT